VELLVASDLVRLDASAMISLSRSLASLEILPGGGLLVSLPPLPLELRGSSRLLSFSPLGVDVTFVNTPSSLFFLTRLAAPPRTVVALCSIDILPVRALFPDPFELGGGVFVGF
jgi:hypothetical protein